MTARGHLRLVKDDAGFPYEGRAADILVDIRPVDVDDTLVPADWAGREDVKFVGDLWLAGRCEHRLALDGDGNAYAVMDGVRIPLRREDIHAPLRSSVVSAARTAFGDDWAAGLASLVLDHMRDGAARSQPSLGTIPPEVMERLGHLAVERRDPAPR